MLAEKHESPWKVLGGSSVNSSVSAEQGTNEELE
jgi:hypothetical protein